MVSLVKKLSILFLFALPCRAQLLDLTKHAQGGGSQDTFLQGGTTTPTWGTLTSGCVAITYTSHAFACVPASDASHNGYLSSTDWMTFNGKQPAGSYALQSTTLTASSPLTGGGDLSTNRSFGCQASSASQAGCLSSTDWSTFNGKQPAGSYALQSITLTANSPITGGGNLSTNRSFSCPTCAIGPGSSTAGHLAGFASTDGITLADITSIPSATTATTQSQNDNSTKISTTAYTDLAIANAIAGVNPAVAVLAATTSSGNTSGLTYNNGASGIGATFTGTANTAIVIDGVTFSAVGQRLLIKNDTQSPSGAFNGVYYVTQIQTTLLPPVLTRALDYDQPSDMNNTGAIPVQSGTVNGSTSWVLTSQVVTVGTTPLTFTQFSLAPSTIVVASSPGAGIARFAGSTQTVTSAELSGDATTSGSNAVSVVKVNGSTPGGTCTTQFVRSLNSSAVPTCATVSNADLPGSGVTPLNGANITLGTGGQVPVYGPCSEGVAQLSTSDTLTNGGTGEQVFSTKCTLAANYLTANRAIRATVSFDTTPTATVPTYLFKGKLCSVSGCGSGTVVNVYTGLASTPTAVSKNTYSTMFFLQGTAAAGASVAVQASQFSVGISLFGMSVRNNQGTQVSGIPTNGTLYWQFSVTFGGTGSNNPVTLTQMIVEGLN